MVTEPVPAFEALLEHLKLSRGFDFTGYKRSSLDAPRRPADADVGDRRLRRVRRLPRGPPGRVRALFNTILINVTGFFRDREAWEDLGERSVAALVASKSPTPPSGSGAPAAPRARRPTPWPSAGRGARARGVPRPREDLRHRRRRGRPGPGPARPATPTEEVAGRSRRSCCERYFEPSGDRFVFRKDLRRSVIFGRNDLVQDAPISRIDLLMCRNTLMYFNAETQARILGRFHFALSDAGVLFLGKAEMLLSHGALFLPIDLKRRAVPQGAADDPRRAAPVFADAAAGGRPGRDDRPGRAARRGLRLAAPARPDRRRRRRRWSPWPTSRPRALFGLSAARHRPAVPGPRGLLPPGRAAPPHRAGPGRTPHRAHQRRRARPRRRGDAPRRRRSARWRATADSCSAVSIAFVDVTALPPAPATSSSAPTAQLETAYEELQSTNEELETTNEELQSTVEELETTNEELQSTNEELETMNEELQSTNDELADDQRGAAASARGELDQANGFLETILTSLRAGVVVLDPELQVQVWNRPGRRTSGGCAPRRPSASTSSTWTSACPPTACDL